MKNMKIKKLYFFVIALLAGISISTACFAQNQEKITMAIEGKKYVLLTAYTAHEKSRGLSVIHELKGADGMIFYFNPPEKAIIWNKDTHLDLEIIWLYKGRVVGRDLLPPEEKSGIIVKTAPKIVDQAVEIVRKQKKHGLQK
jgi:uncharacterized membrane protein (UPF0127 family)